MLGLKLRSKAGASGDTGTSGDRRETAVEPVERQIRPRRDFALGRTLAFALNDDSVEMAAVSRLGSRVKILDVSKVYVPGEVSSEERRSVFLTGVISEYAARYGGRRPDIRLTVAGPETAFRAFVIPELKRSELDSAITYELKKQLPFPVSDCFHDYRRVTSIRDGRQRRTKVSLHAATKQLIRDQLSHFDQLGIEVHRVFNSADAIGQLLPRLPDFSQGRHHAVINVERRRSLISYYRGGNLEFYLYSSLGSAFLAQRSDDMRFDDFAELLAGEIQNSLDYYTGQFSSQSVDCLYLYGDLVYTDEFIERLKGHLGFEFARFPAEKLGLHAARLEEDSNHDLPVCLQALAAAVCDSRLANLLPPERKVVHSRRRVDRRGIAALFVIATLLAGESLVGERELASGKTFEQTLQQDIARFQNSEAFNTYSRIKLRIAADSMFLRETRPTESYLGVTLKELSRLTPGPIRLTGLDYQGTKAEQNLNLQGIVRSRTVPPEVLLAEYVKTLDDSPVFTTVSVSRYTKKEVRDAFELEFNLLLAGIR